MKKYLSISIFSVFLITFYQSIDFCQAKVFLGSPQHTISAYEGAQYGEKVRTSENDILKLNLGIKLIGNTSSYKSKISSLGYDNMTTNSQIECYKKIMHGISKITNHRNADGFYDIEPIVVKGALLRSDEVKKVIYAFQNDNPEVFWIARRFYVICRNNDTIIKMASVMTKRECEEYLKELNSKVDEILRSVPKDLSEYERELFVHDYIVENCTYDRTDNHQKPWEKYTCLGCLVRKKAVCEGYSKATQLLLSRLGVKCRTITGSKGREQHMWNMVNIDGDWYHLDVTWDGTDEFNRYNYFNVTDEVIKFDHHINEEVSKLSKDDLYDKNYNFSLPVCSSKKYNYFSLNSLYVTRNTSNDDLIEYISKIAKNNKKVFYLMIDPEIDLNFIKKLLFQAPDYKFFNSIKVVNSNLSPKSRFRTDSIKYFEDKIQRVVGVKAEYV